MTFSGGKIAGVAGGRLGTWLFGLLLLLGAATPALAEDCSQYPNGVLDGYAGTVFIAATSKQQPGVVSANLKPIIVRDDLYAGCYCRASVTAFAYDKAGNKGVSFGLQNIMKTRDGESVSGRSRAEDDFAGYTTDDGAPEWDQPENYQAPADEDMFA